MCPCRTFVSKTSLQSAQRDVHVLAQRLARLIELHDTTARVVLAVPNDFVTGSLVQDQSWQFNQKKYLWNAGGLNWDMDINCMYVYVYL